MCSLDKASRAGWIDVSLLANHCWWVEFGEEGATEESFCLCFIELLGLSAAAIYGEGLPAQLKGEGFSRGWPRSSFCP